MAPESVEVTESCPNKDHCQSEHLDLSLVRALGLLIGRVLRPRPHHLKLTVDSTVRHWRIQDCMHRRMLENALCKS